MGAARRGARGEAERAKPQAAGLRHSTAHGFYSLGTGGETLGFGFFGDRGDGASVLGLIWMGGSELEVDEGGDFLAHEFYH